MRDQLERIVKIVCIALAALVIFQISRAIVRTHSLARVTIPEVPSLSTNSTAHVEKKNIPGATIAKTIKSGTNVQNHAAGNHETNLVSSISSEKAETNLHATIPAAESNTNAVVVENVESLKTNSPALLASAKTETNLAQPAVLTLETNTSVATKSPEKSTNSVAANVEKNSHASLHPGTNAVSHLPAALLASMNSHSHAPMIGMPVIPGKLPDLPMDVKARVNRIIDSEILGPVIHPMPMALLGIAGNFAFLRGPNGQTDLVKEGDSLGSIKLLRIGINRVLIEDGVDKKELTIFSGFGGETLLPKEGNTNDTTQK
jgi:hypothetical protein